MFVDLSKLGKVHPWALLGVLQYHGEEQIKFLMRALYKRGLAGFKKPFLLSMAFTGEVVIYYAFNNLQHRQFKVVLCDQNADRLAV